MKFDTYDTKIMKDNTKLNKISVGPILTTGRPQVLNYLGDNIGIPNFNGNQHMHHRKGATINYMKCYVGWVDWVSMFRRGLKVITPYHI